ncbi:hypothetical protein NLI96_g9082 [Meripilus lineatus]|uniref:Uncharacterized protein n=1 Tax=Meripilus lineatus TaxID=2056292 RepID=A0AAD5YFN4_9APHY|nr:hypothetical protein NLI96_g9082 [Physisporinus lineatus]
MNPQDHSAFSLEKLEEDNLLWLMAGLERRDFSEKKAVSEMYGWQEASTCILHVAVISMLGDMSILDVHRGFAARAEGRKESSLVDNETLSMEDSEEDCMDNREMRPPRDTRPETVIEQYSVRLD